MDESGNILTSQRYSPSGGMDYNTIMAGLDIVRLLNDGKVMITFLLV